MKRIIEQFFIFLLVFGSIFFEVVIYSQTNSTRTHSEILCDRKEQKLSIINVLNALDKIMETKQDINKKRLIQRLIKDVQSKKVSFQLTLKNKKELEMKLKDKNASDKLIKVIEANYCPKEPQFTAPQMKKTEETPKTTNEKISAYAISLPTPTYPDNAKAVNADGIVIVSIEIDESGNVITAKAKIGHSLLRESAEKAALEAKFTPTKINGRPVKTKKRLIYTFNGNHTIYQNSSLTFYNSIGMYFVEIPKGTLNITSETKITINSFFMGRYEVSQKEWKAIMGSLPDNCHGDEYSLNAYKAGYDMKGDDFPVICVSWKMANEFIKKLNELDEAVVYSLPTEYEWQYAALAETTAPRFYRNDYLDNINSKDKSICSFANIADLSMNEGIYSSLKEDNPLKFIEKAECRDNYYRTSPVGKFLPNKFGLKDIIGNVAEWCFQNRVSSYMARGGSWTTSPKDSNFTSVTTFSDSDKGYNDVGLRIVARIPF